MVVDYLPKDLVLNILFKLPLISCVVRFRCVYKSWCALFFDPNFIYINLLSHFDSTINSQILVKCDDYRFKYLAFSLLCSNTFDMSPPQKIHWLTFVRKRISHGSDF
ncbi:hypothetical protein MANES_04G075293v8 [Manihot esculenta]|uniref:Uncharacterized protein n=1 Tax=Manihot esculenta TaxID=3983 RepID=A0ACB7HT14_MANES|nr:hypothetical protein MANES_04G075293v8 [Manihot esculenta]